MANNFLKSKKNILLAILVLAAIGAVFYFLILENGNGEKQNQKNNGDLNGPEQEIISGTNHCFSLLNGSIVPLKDRQIFEDDQYTEVTITSRDSWDSSRLPQRVLSLENQGYLCYPMPLEFGKRTGGGDIYIQPEVVLVEWSCELDYNDFKHVGENELDQKNILEAQGFECLKEECFNDDNIFSFVWRCVK